MHINSQDVCQSVINYFIRRQILMKPHTCMIQASVAADITQQCTNPQKQVIVVNLQALSMELALCQPSGFQNFQVAPRFTENGHTPDLTPHTYPHKRVKNCARFICVFQEAVECTILQSTWFLWQKVESYRVFNSGSIFLVLLHVLCVKFCQLLVKYTCSYMAAVCSYLRALKLFFIKPGSSLSGPSISKALQRILIQTRV